MGPVKVKCDSISHVQAPPTIYLFYLMNVMIIELLKKRGIKIDPTWNIYLPVAFNRGPCYHSFSKWSIIKVSHFPRYLLIKDVNQNSGS